MFHFTERDFRFIYLFKDNHWNESFGFHLFSSNISWKLFRNSNSWMEYFFSFNNRSTAWNRFDSRKSNSLSALNEATVRISKKFSTNRSSQAIRDFYSTSSKYRFTRDEHWKSIIISSLCCSEKGLNPFLSIHFFDCNFTSDYCWRVSASSCYFLDKENAWQSHSFKSILLKIFPFSTKKFVL